MSKIEGAIIVNKEYEKRMNNRKLDGFIEYKTSSFSLGCSVMIGLLMLFSGYNIITKEVNSILLGFASIYLVSSVFQLVFLSNIKKQLLEKDELSIATRRLGYIYIPFILVGNIFMAIAGFNIVKKEKTIEYTLSIYMILTSISVLLISLINLFKEYVANTFLIGIYGLIGISIFYIISIILISKNITSRVVNPKMKYLAIVLILTAITGNVFALAVGAVILKKIIHKDKDISIEWIDILQRLFRNYMSVIGMFIVILLFSLSLCSTLTFDYDIAIENNYSIILQSPSLQYPFGTDNFGRCVFTRIVFGARISLIVGFSATIFPIIVGGLLGAIAGYYGKKTDNIIMRILDIFYAVPSILLAIAIIAAFGANLFNLIMAISIYNITMYARTMRATVMSLSNCEFVEAAKACGAKNFTIILKHIIPNSLAPIIVRATLGIGGAVLTTSGLSYLGIGVEPHIPEWGNVLRAGSEFLETNSYLAIFPGLAIIILVLAFNFFGDGLRDALDPKLK